MSDFYTFLTSYIPLIIIVHVIIDCINTFVTGEIQLDVYLIIKSEMNEIIIIIIW